MELFFALLGLLVGLIMVIVGAINQQNIIVWTGVVILVLSGIYYAYISTKSDKTKLY